jgi:hypothetical protein
MEGKHERDWWQLSLRRDEGGPSRSRRWRRRVPLRPLPPWGSGPWLALQLPGAVVSGDTLTIYRSSNFAERGF